jgi:deoxyadenosine/deoxycytidine kinase
VTLDEAEYGLYDQIYSRVVLDPPKPDLVIFLQAPVDVLLQRIARRGIKAEQLIDRAYLERLNEAYARFFHDYDTSPLLIVNAAAIDPTANDADYEELLGAVRRMKRGKLYFNPLRHAVI